MTIGILILAAVALAVLQKIWAPRALKYLRFRGKCDRRMTEPDEPVTWTATVSNTSRLPVPFVRLRQVFPEGVSILGTKRWMAAHCQKGVQQWYVEERMTLAPRQSCSRSLQFTIGQRGIYHVGKYRLCAGDLLGFEERATEGDGNTVVAIPRRAKSHQVYSAVSGFLGDISVRRFILEDPILTIGFRDYTGREPMKSISWTRTANAGSLQVKQYDHTAEQSVMILLNTEGGSYEELEACFSLMRSVCEELEKKKIPYGLCTNGNLPATVGNLFRLSSGLGSRHLDTILYALGRADHTCYHSFRYMVQQTIKHRKNNESYIVITPDIAEKYHPLLRSLEATTGNSICVLTGRSEVQAQ